MERHNYPVDVPPTAGDGEIMDWLRGLLQQCSESGDAALGNMQAAAPLSEESERLASLHPSQQPPCYVAAGPQWTSPATQKIVWETPPHGDWREIYRYAVRRVATSAGSSPYVGVKRLLRFREHDGTKRGWTMIQYQLLQEEGPNKFSIEDKMIFCRVFMQGQGQLHHQAPPHVPEDSATIPIVPDPPLQGYTTEFFEDQLLDELLLSFNASDHPIYDDVPVSELISTSTGGYRDNFIKIRSKDPQGVYEACICCNRMLRTHSKNQGTSRLKKHYEGSCKCTAPYAKCSWTPPAH